MKRWINKLDKHYTKIGLYTAGTIIFTVVVLYVLYDTRDFWETAWRIISAVLKPLIIGGVLCYLLTPLVNFFHKIFLKLTKGKKSLGGLSVILSLLVLFGAVLAILTIIAVSMTKQISDINFSSLFAIVHDAKGDASNLTNQLLEYLEKAGLDISKIVNTITSYLSAKMGSIGSGITGFFSSLFFGIIFSVYFMIDGTRIASYWKKVANRIFPRKVILWMKEAGSDLDQCFSGYIRGQAIDALIVGVCTMVIFSLINMPYAFLIGLIIGIGNLIPYFGPVMGYITVTVINILDFNPRMLVIGIVIIAIVMFVDGNIINPRLLAGTISVHPLLVVVALIAGSALGGIVGMLIAVPSAAFIKLQFEKWLDGRESIEERNDL